MSGILSVEQNTNSSDLMAESEFRSATEVNGFDFKTTVIGEFEYATPEK